MSYLNITFYVHNGCIVRKKINKYLVFIINLYIYLGLKIKQRPLLQNLFPDSLGPSLKT